jgi:O-succinylbenzoic acid--CoA ligase
VPRLVALDVVAGSRFVDLMRRTLDDGDAFLPLDQRLSVEDRRQLAHSLGAALVRTADEEFTLDDGRPVADGDAVVIATSGSTGASKGVVLTRDAVRASARLGSRRLQCDADTHWLACLPLSHVGGLSVIFKALDTGADLTVIERFDVDVVTRAAQAGCTHVSLVPTTLRRVDPSLFRCILLGGSRPPSDRPPHVIATYGLTETGSGVVYDGRPLDDVEISLGPEGEILVKSPTNMRAYRDGSTSIDADGWLHTGDVGSMIDGILSVDGRLDDLIKTGGEKVWPEAVERVVSRARPEIEICVVGIDDAEWGQRVVLATTDPDLALADVRAVVTAELPPFHAPKNLVRVREFPRTSIGKIRRRELSRQVALALSDTT